MINTYIVLFTSITKPTQLLAAKLGVPDKRTIRNNDKKFDSIHKAVFQSLIDISDDDDSECLVDYF